MDKWSILSAAAASEHRYSSFALEDRKTSLVCSEIEQRTGFSFDSHFSYDSTTKYESIFSYGGGNNAEKPTSKTKTKSKDHHSSHHKNKEQEKNAINFTPVATQQPQKETEDWITAGTALPDDDVFSPTSSSSPTSGLSRIILIPFSVLLLILFFPLLCWCHIKKVRDNEVYVVRRLGHQRKPRSKPGFLLLLPLVDKGSRVNLGEMNLTITPLTGMTKDEARVELLDVVVTYQVEDPARAAFEVTDVHEALRALVVSGTVAELRRLNVRDVERDLDLVASGITYAASNNGRNWGIRVLRANISSVKVLQESASTPLLASSSSEKPTQAAPQDNNGPSNKMPAYNHDPVSSLFDRLEAAAMQLTVPSPTTSRAAAQKAASATLPLDFAKLTHGRWKKVLQCALGRVDDLLNEDEDRDGPSVRSALRGVVYHVHVFEGDLRSLPEAEMFFYVDADKGVATEGKLCALPSTGQQEVKIRLAVSHILELMRGEGSPISSVMIGRIHVEGDLRLAAKLKVLQKHLKYIVAATSSLSNESDLLTHQPSSAWDRDAVV